MSWTDDQPTVSPGGGVLLQVACRWGTYPIAAMTPILESVDMEGFSQVLTCAVSTQSFRRVNTERATLPPRLRRLLKPEAEDVAMESPIAARGAGARMSRECSLSMVASCIAFCSVLLIPEGSIAEVKERGCRALRVAGCRRTKGGVVLAE